MRIWGKVMWVRGKGQKEWRRGLAKGVRTHLPKHKLESYRLCLCSQSQPLCTFQHPSHVPVEKGNVRGGEMDWSNHVWGLKGRVKVKHKTTKKKHLRGRNKRCENKNGSWQQWGSYEVRKCLKEDISHIVIVTHVWLVPGLYLHKKGIFHVFILKITMNNCKKTFQHDQWYIKYIMIDFRDNSLYILFNYNQSEIDGPQSQIPTHPTWSKVERW